jgi:hypothetical protein
LAEPNHPTWSGEIRESRTLDGQDGATRDALTQQHRLQGGYDSAAASFGLLVTGNSYTDLTQSSPWYETNLVQASARLSPLPRLTVQTGFQEHQDASANLNDFYISRIANASYIVAPMVQLRGQASSAGALAPTDGLVLSRVGAGLDLDTRIKLRMSGDLWRDSRWNGATGTVEPHDVKKVQAMKEAGSSLFTLARTLDDLEAGEWSQVTDTVAWQWQNSAGLRTRLGVDRITTLPGGSVASTQTLLHPEAGYQSNVGRAVSLGLSGGATLSNRTVNSLTGDLVRLPLNNLLAGVWGVLMRRRYGHTV